MPDTIEVASNLLIRKLEKIGELELADRRAIAALPFVSATMRAGHSLVQEGQTVTNCWLLLAGYVCRQKNANRGSRQILSFHMPGDLLDLQHLVLPQADHGIQAITDLSVATISTAALRELARARPAIGEAFWRDTLIESSIFREWVLNIGQRDAKSRIAHMLCEFAIRREAAGLGEPEHFDLPMTQQQIADATGLTPVHVNRMLQMLGAEAVIEREGRRITISDWDKMRRVADFEPGYLHLDRAKNG